MTDNEIVLSETDGSRLRAKRAPIITSRTRLAGIAMALGLIVLVAFDYIAWSGAVAWTEMLAPALLTLVPLVVAGIVIPVARSFGSGVIRTQWMLFGLGMLSVGVGNVIFIILYITTGSDPYPSVADIFTLVGYACFAAGLILAIRAYRDLLDIRSPLLIAAGVAVVAMALSYATVIGPYVIFAPAETQSLATRIFNTTYLVLDVFVLLMPSVALGLLVRRLGTGRLAWPWWLVVASSTILAVTDTVFAHSGYVGAGRTPLIDAGYALAPLLLGFAVLVARDIYKS